MAISDDMQGLARRLVEPLRGYFLGYGSGYTSGTWTPFFTGSTSAGTITYTTQAGRWVRVGAMVWITARIAANVVTAPPGGDLQVHVLPFTPVSSTNQVHALGISQWYLNLSAGAVGLQAAIFPGETVIRFLENYDSSPATLLPGSALLGGGNVNINLSGWYEIASA